VGKLLSQLEFTIPLESEGMNYIIEDGDDPDDAAIRLIKKHPELLNTWLANVTTLEGSDGLEAVKAHVGVN